MKLIITGGRHYNDKDTVFRVLNEWQAANGTVSFLVQGGATGADSLAREWAKCNMVKSDGFVSVYTWIMTYKADWDSFGKAAGPIRNREMCTKERDADALIAFPGNTGTKGCIDIARELGIPVIIVPDRKGNNK